MEPIGKPPIAAPLLIAGKLALFLCWIFPLMDRFGLAREAGTGTAALAAGIALYAAGGLLGTLSFTALGRSLSVGLPESATKLKTGGVYRISRNPIYVAAYLLCAGSCVIRPDPVNFALFAAAALIHHRIILSEEKFLEGRFGGDYLAYKRSVRRYL